MGSSVCFASNSTFSYKRDKRVDRREINFFVSLQLALRSSYSSPKKLRDFSASTWNQKITCGIPQGSLLGPLFFLLHLNDLCRVSNILKFLLFADDTKILVSGKEPDPLINSANFELSKIVIRFQVNKLSLNIRNIICCIHRNNGIALAIFVKVIRKRWQNNRLGKVDVLSRSYFYKPLESTHLPCCLLKSQNNWYNL